MGSKEEMKDAHLYLPESLWNRLLVLAEQNERSLTGQIRFMLIQQLEKKL